MRRLGSIVADWAHVARRWPLALLNRTSPDAFEQGDRIPVVLLPGIWEPWRFMLPLARALNAAGHPVYPVPALGLNGAPLDRSTDVVVEAIAEHPADQVILVAHSKGGLIGKQLMLHPEAGPRVAGLVALCSPFGGSSLSLRLLARTPLGLFAPSNATLLALAAERAVNTRIVSIGAAWDEMVPEGTHLEAARNITLSESGHFRPLVARRVLDVVVEEVRGLAPNSA